MTIEAWAARWGVSSEALSDLRLSLLGIDGGDFVETKQGWSEAAVQSRVRVAASRRGMRLWRNNVGAIHDDEKGVHLRYGLANDSPAVNAVCKSGDLIGIRPRIVTPDMIGSCFGQFVSIECKHSRWKWSGDEREKAQANWASLVTALGGEARFVTSEEDI